jgi:hypothetical protein
MGGRWTLIISSAAAGGIVAPHGHSSAEAQRGPPGESTELGHAQDARGMEAIQSRRRAHCDDLSGAQIFYFDANRYRYADELCLPTQCCRYGTMKKIPRNYQSSLLVKVCVNHTLGYRAPKADALPDSEKAKPTNSNHGRVHYDGEKVV